jgi:hypothetical protein
LAARADALAPDRRRRAGLSGRRTRTPPRPPTDTSSARRSPLAPAPRPPGGCSDNGVLPLDHHPFQDQKIQSLERTEKRAGRGYDVAPGGRMAPAAQLAALGLGEPRGRVGQLALSTGYAGQLGQRQHAQHGPPGMPAALGPARIRHAGQPLQQAGPLSRGQRAAGHRLLIKRSQVRRQTRRAQRGRAGHIQRAHPEWFGPVVAHVKVLGVAAEAGRRAQERPTGGLTGGDVEELPINKPQYQRLMGQVTSAVGRGSDLSSWSLW